MKTTHIFALLSVALLSAACTESATGVRDSERIVLEIEYINYAWEPTYFGFFVDGTGRIFRYDRNGAAWPDQDAASWSVRELDDKFVPVRNQVDEVPSAEIAALAPVIDAAAAGTLSPVKSECADAGTLTYRAYRYNPDDGRYSAVLLRQEGDHARQNTSQAAQQLIAYIRSLELLEELLGCDP